MADKSKREIEREVERLTPDTDGAGEVGLVIDMRDNEYTSPEESPRPELTVPHPDGDGYHIPTPKVPLDGHTAILTVSEDVRETWPDTDDPAPTVAELWDDLTPEQLREERRLRERQGDPLPDILDPSPE